MDYSFTEKKRIRKDFGKRLSVLDVPPLLDIQLGSYREFLQADAAIDDRIDRGLQAAFKSVFPIVSYSNNAQLEYVNYRLGKPIIYTLIPMIGMMIMTVTAMIMKLRANFESRHWPLLVVGAVILVLVVWLVIESILAFRRHAGGNEGKDRIEKYV